MYFDFVYFTKELSIYGKAPATTLRKTQALTSLTGKLGEYTSQSYYCMKASEKKTVNIFLR